MADESKPPNKVYPPGPPPTAEAFPPLRPLNPLPLTANPKGSFYDHGLQPPKPKPKGSSYDPRLLPPNPPPTPARRPLLIVAVIAVVVIALSCVAAGLAWILL